MSLGSFSLCHSVGSLADDDDHPLYRDVAGHVTIPINTEDQWLHILGPVDDQDTDSRSSLLRWIVDSETQVCRVLKIYHDALEQSNRSSM